MIIAGDIGGTKSHLVAYVEEHGKLSAVARKRYVTRELYRTLTATITT